MPSSWRQGEIRVEGRVGHALRLAETVPWQVPLRDRLMRMDFKGCPRRTFHVFPVSLSVSGLISKSKSQGLDKGLSL
jgi:hypothetical protein